MVAQRRNGLFKHLSPMTWPEATGEEPQDFRCGRCEQMVSQRCAPAGQLPATASCLGEFGIAEVQSQQGEFQTECQRTVSKLQIDFDGLRHPKMNRNE